MVVLSFVRKLGEITEKAEVSRNSFYRNYDDKEDIIRKYLYQLLSDWNTECLNPKSVFQYLRIKIIYFPKTVVLFSEGEQYNEPIITQKKNMIQT